MLQPSEMMERGNLVRQSVRKVHASTGGTAEQSGPGSTSALRITGPRNCTARCNKEMLGTLLNISEMLVCFTLTENFLCRYSVLSHADGTEIKACKQEDMFVRLSRRCGAITSCKT